ncbi:hypothetical protein CRUP_011937 [Coryphaenoides rupestris]|nr:hypothetical protein CRUP_011937 [Coryphaenoides rupestris]
MAAGFDLVPMDGGGRISLPEGETVLGRGPLLGIHVNPCFTLLGGDLARPQPLERECWHTLCDGEVFSLLPGSLAYRVEAVGGASLTPSSRLLPPPLRLLPLHPPITPLH